MANKSVKRHCNKPSSISFKNGEEERVNISFLLLSHSVVSDSLWPHGLQHAKLPCPSPSPRDECQLGKGELIEVKFKYPLWKNIQNYLLNFNIYISNDLVIPPYKYPQKNIHTHIYIHMNIHSIIIHNCQNWNNIFIKCRINMVNAWNKILWNNKNKLIITTHNYKPHMNDSHT